jgi:hypothetical protein
VNSIKNLARPLIASPNSFILNEYPAFHIDPYTRSQGLARRSGATVGAASHRPIIANQSLSEAG